MLLNVQVRCVCVVFSVIWGLENDYDMTMCVVFSAIWGLENDYDMTMCVCCVQCDLGT